MPDHRQQIQQWLEKLRAGTLAEDDLQRALDQLDDHSNDATKQRLLYLQAATTNLESDVLGMSLVENGQVLGGPDDPEEWPYHTVLEAMDDGWRVIKFPEMALLLQEDQTIGLGCEFILEK